MAIVMVDVHEYGKRIDRRLDWDKLEPGDKVATLGRWDSVTIYTVVRTTPTQIVAKTAERGNTWDARFRRSDGRRIGESYGDRLVPVDDPGVLRVLQVKVANQLHNEIGQVFKKTRPTAEDSRAACKRVAELATAALAEMERIANQGEAPSDDPTL